MFRFNLLRACSSDSWLNLTIAGQQMPNKNAYQPLQNAYTLPIQLNQTLLDETKLKNSKNVL